MADNPVPTKEEKEAQQAAILEKVRKITEAIALLTEVKNGLNGQFAEVGNSDKVTYTDRDTGEVKLWGISASVMKRHESAITEGLTKVNDIIGNL